MSPRHSSLNSMTTSPQYHTYRQFTLVPTGDTGLCWTCHAIPTSPSPLLSRKWDYILRLFNVWYEDADGDHITLGNTTEGQGD